MPLKREAPQRAKTPANTGAQQVVAIPENIPRTKTENALCLFTEELTLNGKEKCLPVIRIKPEASKIPPNHKNSIMILAEYLSQCRRPQPNRKKYRQEFPKKYKVIKNILYRSRNIEAKYAGNKTVLIQHGAKEPLLRDKSATNDALINKSIYNAN